ILVVELDAKLDEISGFQEVKTTEGWVRCLIRELHTGGFHRGGSRGRGAGAECAYQGTSPGERHRLQSLAGLPSARTRTSFSLGQLDTIAHKAPTVRNACAGPRTCTAIRESDSIERRCLVHDLVASRPSMLPNARSPRRMRKVMNQ